MIPRIPTLVVFLVGLAMTFSALSHAAVISATDLSSISLGAKIVGPVGPEVESTISFIDGTSRDVIGVADIISSVSCDARFADCSAAAVAGFDDVVYTYQHQVIPGVDLANDPPFPSPDSVVPLDGATEFRMLFPATGFLRVAGFDFGQATAAIGGTNITIERLTDGSLLWTMPVGAGWDTNEPITFFWQTTQRPSGPSGQFSTTNGTLEGIGNGPIPEPVPLPAAGWLLLGGLVTLRRRRSR